MADERVDSEIVTQFLLDTCLNTCRLGPQLTRHAVQAAACCSLLATQHPDDDVEADLIPLTTGSAAEFYIDPMLPLVGDVDVMYHHSTMLAIPRGHPPPTQLPAEFHDNVKVVEIIDSHLPGYVYLKLRYLLTYCPEDEKYSYVEFDREAYVRSDELGSRNYVPDAVHILNYFMYDMKSDVATQTERHGPANLLLSDVQLPWDAVPCVRCLLWPPQAADLPTRHRNYNWPDSATVDRVVNNGCDVVPVAHRQCRQHTWMGKFQHRLSFSRAEIVLINSWIPVQQIVYHMLRVFMKIEQLTDSADNTGTNILSNYHIKTLMLWACELKPRSWWIEGLNLVKICVKLLHTLSVWLTDRRCQHYFVNNCNLINTTLSMEMVVSELRLNDMYLSLWFVENYIGELARRCPDVITPGMNVQNTISSILLWRVASSLHDSWRVNVRSEIPLEMMSGLCLTSRSYIMWKDAFTRIDARLTVYFSAVALLQLSFRISRDGFTDNIADILTTILGHFVEVPRYYNQRSSSVLSLCQAAKLMKVVANKSLSTVQLIEIELSKAYLHRALRCKDSDSDSIYCLANVYLAVLYYTTGQHQTAIDHCTLVMRSQDHSQCSSHVVQGEFLSKIDDDIDTVLGLTVFYQYVLSAALNQQQTQYVSVFSTELFARYLHIRCLSVINCHESTQASLPDEIQQYRQRLCESPDLVTTDVLAFKCTSIIICQSVKRKLTVLKEENKPAISHHLDTSQLAELLQKSAVEHLTASRQLEAQHFGYLGPGVPIVIVTTDFEALYAYKHGQYQRCLQLSAQNVRTLIGHPSHGLSYVFLCPEFTQLMDDDIVSVLALTFIVDPSRRDVPARVSVDQLSLSLYLMVKCQMQLHHSVKSLAQSLDYIEFARRRRHDLIRRDPQLSASLDLLVLKLVKRTVLRYITNE